MNRNQELRQIRKELRSLRERVNKIKQEGFKLEIITTALTQLGADVDALIAKGAGSITPAQAQTIADWLNALDAKVKAAISA